MNLSVAYDGCINKLELDGNTIEYFKASLEQQKDTWNKPIHKANYNLNLGMETNFCLRLSFRNCTKCIEAELRNLKNAANIIGFEKIVILLDVQDSSQVNYFIKEYDIPFKTIYCNHLDIGIEAYNNPYYFVTCNKIIQYPFLPFRNEPGLFKLYVQNVLTIIN